MTRKLRIRKRRARSSSKLSKKQEIEFKHVRGTFKRLKRLNKYFKDIRIKL